MLEGGYSSTQVCSITKVPYGTLFEWMSTGLITPSLVKPQGRGKHARWGFRDLVAIRTIQGLRQHNVSMQAIREAVRYIQQKLDVELPLSELWLATDGKELYTLDTLDGERLLALCKQQGQMTMLLCVKLRSTTDELRTLLQRSTSNKSRAQATTHQQKSAPRAKSA